MSEPADHRGIFCHPTETLEQFARRAHKCAPVNTDANATDLLKKLFHIAPDWIEVVWSAKGLMPWEAAAAWIDSDAEGDPVCRIQVKKCSWYPKHEVIAHEMVHAMRAGFQEEKFEEILAYQTSSNRFRRYWGPLFSKPAETKWFLASLLLPWLIFLAEICFGLPFDVAPLMWIPCIALGALGLRLYRKQRVFAKCCRALARALPSPENALGVVLRLTDGEIDHFSRSSSSAILAYAVEKQTSDLRWQQIFTTFFADGQERFRA